MYRIVTLQTIIRLSRYLTIWLPTNNLVGNVCDENC